MRQQSGAWITPDFVATDVELSPTARLLAGKIHALSLGKLGYCYATDEYLGGELGKSGRTVRRYLKELWDRGYLKVEKHTSKRGIERRMWLVHPEGSGHNLPDPSGQNASHPPVKDGRTHIGMSERDSEREREGDSSLSLSLEDQKLPKGWKPEEVEVFDHYLASRVRAMNGRARGPEPKKTTTIRGKIRARLKEGFTVADLKAATDGMLFNPWHQERGLRDLALVVRNADKVRYFLEVSEKRQETPAEPGSAAWADDEVRRILEGDE